MHATEQNIKAQMMADAAVILATLVDVDPQPAIESHCHLALGGDIERCGRVRNVITKVGWAKIDGHLVSLADEGRDVGREINARMAEAKARKAAAGIPPLKPVTETPVIPKGAQA